MHLIDNFIDVEKVKMDVYKIEVVLRLISSREVHGVLQVDKVTYKVLMNLVLEDKILPVIVLIVNVVL